MDPRIVEMVEDIYRTVPEITDKNQLETILHRIETKKSELSQIIEHFPSEEALLNMPYDDQMVLEDNYEYAKTSMTELNKATNFVNKRL
jgi:exonuclease VII small subunit